MAAQRRELRAFVAQVGGAFRLRVSPSVGGWALLLGLLAAAGAGGGTILLLAALGIALLCMRMALRCSRFAPTLPLWAGIVAVLLLVLPGWLWTTLAPWQAALLCWSVIVAALSLLAVQLLLLQNFSRQLQRRVNHLDEAALLALLPPPVAADARRWLDGEDSHHHELALVIHLAALHAALAQCDGGRREARAVVLG